MKSPTVQISQVVEVGTEKYVFDLASTTRFDSLMRQLKEAEKLVDAVRVEEIKGRVVDIRILNHAEHADVTFSNLLNALDAS